MKYVEYIQNGTGSGKERGWGVPLNYQPSTTNDITVRCKINWTQNSYSSIDGNLLIGSSAGGGNFFRLFCYRENYFVFDCPYDSDGRVDIPFTMGQEAEFEARWNNQVLTLTNLTTQQTATGTTNSSPIFSSSWSVWKENSDISQGTKIYYIDIYEGNTKVKEYRPALDNNNVPCLYEKLGHTYHYNYDSSKVLTAGPVTSSISVSASKNVLAATGETITLDIECQNAWTATEPVHFTLSQTAGTGNATITLTAPANTGATNISGTVGVTDSVTGDYDGVTIRQKHPTNGQPLYLGADEINEIYLGADAITEAYLGDVLVFSSGPFVGLKITPSTISFNSASLTGEVKVKSSEAWTMTLPSWLTASVITGGTGETIVTLTASAQTATGGTISVTSANYSASTSAVYYPVVFMDYIYEANSAGYQQAHHLDTGIAHTASTMNVEIEYFGLGGNSDRMVGYQQGDAGCTSDSTDFRVFGFSTGTFDYMTYRYSFGNIHQGYQHLTIGDCYCYDNQTGQYLCQGSAVGAVPSPNCHILVDVSLIKVKSVKIKDGNNVLFDGVAAELGGIYGLFDRVGGQLITNYGISMTGDTLPVPTPTGETRTIGISSIPIPVTDGENAGGTDIYIEDENENYASLNLTYSDPSDETSYEENVDATQGFNASYDSGYFEVEGEWGDNITINYSYTDGACESVPSEYETEQPTFENGVISTSFPTPESDPGCECEAQGGTWDGVECTYPEPDPCEGMGEEECECVSNGGEWIVPEIGDPYCQQGGDVDCEGDPECLCTQGGGTWTYNDMTGDYYCDCGGNPECECISAGGEWDDINQDCIYPE